MTRQTMQIPFKAFLTIVALSIMSAALAVAFEDPPARKPEKEASDAEKETRRAAEQFVGGIDVEILSGDKWIKVKRIDKPLLFYGDSTRDNDRGSLWAWGEKGRPVAVLELFQDTIRRAVWVCSLCNTSGGKIRALRGGEPWWMENESDVAIKDIPQAPAPAADAPQRQRQMKFLSQKFTGHEFWDPDNSRYELRRIERPVHTYRDEAEGLLEGGLFILAYGTNPELLLFLEAKADPKDKSKAAWQFVVGRSAHAELHLEFDGKEVFDGPRGDRLSGANKPYFNSRVTTKTDADPEK